MAYKFNKQREPSHNRHSPYTGVRWSTEYDKWYATISEKGVTYHCGFHDNDKEAAKARDKKIIALSLKKPLQVLKPFN